jgi:hypothetical protein
VSDSKLQKFKLTEKKGESLFFVLFFGVIAMMLLALSTPPTLILFFGGFSFLMYKMFRKPQLGGTRDIFEFYLSANDILRDDDRKWFGFEIQEILIRGERILQSMPDPPPLMYYTIGALYNRVGSHKAAIEHLSYISENENSDETHRSSASPELRRYVQILRKIEQNPSEAPLTTTAIRSLERARKNRVKSLLEESRREIWNAEEKRQSMLEMKTKDPGVLKGVLEESIEASNKTRVNYAASKSEPDISKLPGNSKKDKSSNTNSDGRRQPISEVLHEIYDQNRN